jgi:hypothetical protein
MIIIFFFNLIILKLIKKIIYIELWSIYYQIIILIDLLKCVRKIIITNLK